MLILCDVEEWDAREAADLLGRSVAATKSLLYRARARAARPPDLNAGARSHEGDRPMNCVEIKDLLDLHVDGELPEEMRARIERHLLRCADCAFQARSLEQSRALLREAYPRVAPAPAFREKMVARLQDAFADLLRLEPEPAANQRALPLDLLR